MSHRLSLRVLAVAVVAVAVLVAVAGPAAAHARLVSSEPRYGRALAGGADHVRLQFDYPVEVAGAQVKLERAARALKLGRPTHPSPDHKEISIPLPRLGAGGYLLTWFLFGKDGDVMGGELPFTVSPAAVAGAPTPPLPPTTRPSGEVVRRGSFTPLETPQDAARMASFMALAVLLGGLTFVAGLWRAGARLRRTRLVLWGSLAGALAANSLALGLKGVAVQGRSALAALTPSALTALDGTHIGRVLTLRLGFLLLAAPVVAYLTLAPERAVRSHRWLLGAAGAGLGALATHGMLSHAFARGPLASAVAMVHVGAVAVWLGGLTILATVVLPRRRRDELSCLVPRWSRLAFVSLASAVAAGPVLLILVSPRWAALPGSEYGRFLLLKMGLVVGLLVAASRARSFAGRHLPALVDPAVRAPVDLAVLEAARAEARVPIGVGATHPGLATVGPEVVALDPLAGGESQPPLAGGGPATVDVASLRPFVAAVALELAIAATVLATTAILVGRPPPT